MAFDQKTRNLLQRIVTACRRVLDREFTAQLQELYGIQPDGAITPLSALDHLGDEEMDVARLLRERINHLEGGAATESLTRSAARPEHIARVIREQAFTVLNRLAALRLCEERGLVLECVRKGVNSEGLQLFTTSAGNALGETHEAYRVYLFCLFDELALDLGVLFDRYSPLALLFPRPAALAEVLNELNGTGKAADREAMPPEQFAEIWKADETIGWIYQYYNDEAERKKMREESSAPRNSRELAVRNQFFTPRYVVEFLTDNTLGRIWYEMTQGGTRLKEQSRYLVRRPNEIFLQTGQAAPEQPKQDNLSQEDLLRQPVHIPHRPLKDPRAVLLLDPACGSMHFGLYAFDLFEVIYDEAWALEEKLGEHALSRPPWMISLHATYAGKDAFLKDVPRLIIEHNLHGIDIDPRAAQIAGLALWLRAQNAWKAMDLKPGDRPRIKRSNIVCAEPMPGEKELLREFVEREFPAAERAVCLRLLEAIFDKMQLAGEAGSLLKIEEEIRSAIAEAKKSWEDRRQEFFDPAALTNLSRRPGTQRELPVLNLQSSTLSLSDESFWLRIEERIYAALRDYAEQAEGGGGFQRRLFAEDAVRGFAFIDVCRKRYDVVLMNPPFGDRVLSCETLFKDEYGDGKLDLYHYFYERADQLRSILGRVGAITPRTLLYQAHYIGLREKWLNGEVKPEALIELDLGVLDAATVRPALVVLGKSRTRARTFYRNLKHSDLPADDLLDAVTEFCVGRLGSRCTLHAVSRFAAMPGKRFSLWATDRILNSFLEHSTLEPALGKVTEGLSNEDDMRFLRCWWEIPCSITPHWRPYGKFDARSTFVSDFSIVIDWSPSGYTALGEVGNRRANESFYFRSGCAFTRSCEVGMAATILPEGVVFSGVSRYFLPIGNARMGLLAYLNTSLTEGLHLVLTPDRDRISGTLRKLPVVVDSDTLERLQQPGLEIWKQKLSWLGSTDETQRLFWDALGRIFTEGRPANRDATCSILRSKLNELEQRVEAIVTSACPFNSEDLAVIAEEVKERSGERDLVTWNPDICANSGAAAAMISSALGVAFGRWDIRYATGEQAAPELPDPFAALPVCPPGLLQNAQGLPARPEDVPAAYPVRISWDGILVDDPNHPLDIERRVREVIEIIWSGKEGGTTAEAIEHEACEILGVKSLRDYFRKPTGFFADHLKRYSKSRRQAPIYWPLSTASGSYILWIYYHRLTPDTLYKCVQQFVNPKLADVEKELMHLRTVLTANEGGTKEGKRLEELEGLRRELIELRTDLELWAPKWKPNLNDGVLVTAAPLWKLFRLPKWQKDLKACWQELEKGDYDWAHMALSLWPDRVREKCKTDRSLAIAHGLEDLCTVQAPVKKAKKSKKKAKADQIEIDDGREE
jgi:hypothetical protein